MNGTEMAIQRLLLGESVQIRVTGSSMAGRIESGSKVRIEPIGQDETVTVGDIVLCRVHGNVYLHAVSAQRNGDEYQISNNHGHVNGWTNRSRIFGRYAGTIG